MSAWKQLLAATLGVIFGLAILSALAFFVLAIWTGDDRWGLTGVVVGFTGLIGAIGTATYPGWDW